MIATESAQGFEILRFLSSPANSIAILDGSSAKIQLLAGSQSGERTC